MGGLAVISHRHRCIYVTVPKCASTSLGEWLLAHAGARHAFPPHWYPGTLPHRLQWAARALNLYPDYFTFTFLRDPCRRFASLYRHANRLAEQRALLHPRAPAGYGTLAEFAELCAELLDDSRDLWGPPATAWFRDNAGRRYGPSGLPLRDLAFVFAHARPQVDFLPDRNPHRLYAVARPRPAPLGFIGTVETLAADFARLQERLDLPRLPLPRHNASTSTPGPVKAPRCDAATRRLVEELYAEDLAFAASRADDAPAPCGAAAGVHHRDIERGRLHAPSPLAMRVRRACFAVFSLEIGLERRIRRAPTLRRPLSPLVRLRRRFAGRTGRFAATSSTR